MPGPFNIPNYQDSVGQQGTMKEAVEKYDAEHGKYVDNAGFEHNGAAAGTGPAAPDPSPFRIGGA